MFYSEHNVQCRAVTLSRRESV